MGKTAAVTKNAKDPAPDSITGNDCQREFWGILGRQLRILTCLRPHKVHNVRGRVRPLHTPADGS